MNSIKKAFAKRTLRKLEEISDMKKFLYIGILGTIFNIGAQGITENLLKEHPDNTGSQHSAEVFKAFTGAVEKISEKQSTITQQQKYLSLQRTLISINTLSGIQDMTPSNIYAEINEIDALATTQKSNVLKLHRKLTADKNMTEIQKTSLLELMDNASIGSKDIYGITANTAFLDECSIHSSPEAIYKCSDEETEEFAVASSFTAGFLAYMSIYLGLPAFFNKRRLEDWSKGPTRH